MKEEVKRVVVVGGGFAGINFIQSLEGDKSFHITLVDTNNFNHFPPLLYQVASSYIEPSNISYPFRRMFQEKENLRFHLGTLVSIDAAANTLVTDTGSISYDYLVLALGTESNYFGMENVKKYSLPMKSIGDAVNMRNHLLLSMEKAVRTEDLKEREKYMNTVIAGGGPSGVELAGVLAEMRRNLTAKEYPEVSNMHGQIYLVDSGPALLGAMSPEAQKEASKVLTELGVIIKLNVAVKDCDGEKVVLGNGDVIPTTTLIWASGVIGRELPGLPAESIVRGRRVAVDAYNKVNATQNIYAIGDISFQTTDPDYPKGHPQLAQVAIQQGHLLATNMKRMQKHDSLKPFKYFNKGSMAIISKHRAVADLPKLSFTGYFAWLIWLFIHIIPIAGVGNKAKLLFNWFWAFISNNPTLRLIIRPRIDDASKTDSRA